MHTPNHLPSMFPEQYGAPSTGQYPTAYGQGRRYQQIQGLLNPTYGGTPSSMYQRGWDDLNALAEPSVPMFEYNRPMTGNESLAAVSPSAGGALAGDPYSSTGMYEPFASTGGGTGGPGGQSPGIGATEPGQGFGVADALGMMMGFTNPMSAMATIANAVTNQVNQTPSFSPLQNISSALGFGPSHDAETFGAQDPGFGVGIDMGVEFGEPGMGFGGFGDTEAGMGGDAETSGVGDAGGHGF